MQKLAAFLLTVIVALSALVSVPAAGRETVTIVVEEYWVADGPTPGSERFVVAPARPERNALATFGPFRVVDHNRAQLVGITDERSPAQFAAMLRAYPGIDTLDMIDCGGTLDDRANLKVARMIRYAGITTRVPSGGSVRSGGVELFIAGASRQVEDGAEFAVHAWLDEAGLQATDYAADAPENRKYLEFYREMGMDRAQASAFYAMTNSVPFEQALWFDGVEMRRWVETDDRAAKVQEIALPKLAYLDLGLALN